MRSHYHRLLSSRGGTLIRGALVAFALVALLGLGVPEVAAQTPDLEQDEDFNKGGRTAFQFLKIGVGARQAALGEASIATVRDANSAFWNPAGISGVEGYEASFSYARWLADMNYVAGAIAGRWGEVGTFALSIAALDYGDIPEAVVGGSGGDARTGETFTGNDFLVGLSYARNFTDRLAIGVGVKYVQESLFDYSENTVAFDVGTTYDIGYKGLQLAMSAQNFAGSVRWLDEDQADRQEGYDIPLVFRIGLSGALVGANGFMTMPGPHRVDLSAEAINTNDFSERIHFGLEYTFNELFVLRGGYRFGYDEGNWALGAGLNPEVGGVRMRFDYAYVGYSFLAAPQRLSVSFAF
jgi:hypothetical protein